MAHGKIARLPRMIREQLNRRMAEGEQGNDLVDWLNSLPEVQVVLAEHFFGRAISAQNLSEWKKHGYEAWVLKQELVACAGEVVADAEEVEKAFGQYHLTEPLVVLLGARYAKLLSGWDGKLDKAFLQQVQGLDRLSQQIVRLRRSEQASQRMGMQKKHAEQRLALQAKKAEEQQKAAALKGHEAWMLELAEWPDVQERFWEVYEYYNERKNGGEIRTIKVNQT